MSVEETVGPPLIPGLQYRALLGSGGFAHVYRYEQTALGRDVAVKVIHGFDEAARRHFASEASLMARLSSHPHVVPVYQVGLSEDDRPYLVMQLCPPPSLSGRLKAHPLPVSEVLQIGVQLAGAVETAHRLGILHRDIKPANILFSEYGRPLLSDFGIAQSLEATAQPVPAFSPAWAPPEQAVGQGFAPTTDVYSLCATLWAALTGKAPLGPSRPELTAQAIRRPDVPAALEDLLRSGLAEDAGLRPRSALDLGRALQRIQGQLGLAVTPIELWAGTDQHTAPVQQEDDRTHLVTLVEPETPTAPAAPTAVAATIPAPTLAEPSPVEQTRTPSDPPPAHYVTPPTDQRPSSTPWPAHPVQQAARKSSSGRRTPIVLLLALTLLALVTLAVAFLLPRGGQQEPDPSPTPAVSTQPASPGAQGTPQTQPGPGTEPTPDTAETTRPAEEPSTSPGSPTSEEPPASEEPQTSEEPGNLGGEWGS